MSYKIAIASTDGKVVNQHFGRADKFYIVVVDDEDQYKPVEVRDMTPVCDGGDHDDDSMKLNIERLSDCEYVLVSRIGISAENLLESKGIGVYVIPDLIDAALRKLISYVGINKLIDQTDKNNIINGGN